MTVSLPLGGMRNTCLTYFTVYLKINETVGKQSIYFLHMCDMLPLME